MISTAKKTETDGAPMKVVEACHEVVACDVPSLDEGGNWGTCEWLEDVQRVIDRVAEVINLKEPAAKKGEF